MRRLIGLLLFVSLVAVVTSCRSSRGTVKSSGAGRGGSATHVVDYKSMRKHVESMQYDDDIIRAIIKGATEWIGTPYRYAGNSRDGVDCSGLILQVFKDATGSVLPRSSAAQQLWCNSIDGDTLRPGDLLFFATGSDRQRVSHVGLYIGNDEMIHASSSRGVVVSQLRLPYYTTRFHSAGRPQMLACRNHLIGVEISTDTVPPASLSDVESLIDDAVVESFEDFFD